MNCPVCKEERLQCTVVQENRATRTYWICQNCGNKFRDPQDLEKEAAATKRCLPAGIVVTILGVIVFVIGLVLRGQMNDAFYWTSAYRMTAGICAMLITLGIFTAVLGIMLIVMGIMIPQKLEKERAEIVKKIGTIS